MRFSLMDPSLSQKRKASMKETLVGQQQGGLWGAQPTMVRRHRPFEFK